MTYFKKRVILKKLVTSGLGQLSATLEEPLYIGKQFDSENTLVIDKPINGTEHFVKIC